MYLSFSVFLFTLNCLLIGIYNERFLRLKKNYYALLNFITAPVSITVSCTLSLGLFCGKLIEVRRSSLIDLILNF